MSVMLSFSEYLIYFWFFATVLSIIISGLIFVKMRSHDKTEKESLDLFVERNRDLTKKLQILQEDLKQLNKQLSDLATENRVLKAEVNELTKEVTLLQRRVHNNIVDTIGQRITW